MSKDIRQFFSAAGGSKKETPKLLAGTNSKGTAKRLMVLSDSDDDDSIIPSSVAKRSKAASEKISSKLGVKKQTPKREQKIVNPMEIYGKDKVKRSAEVTVVGSPSEEQAEAPQKRKKNKQAPNDAPGWDESFSDVDFLSTLDQLDAIEAQAARSKTNSFSAVENKAESIPIKISEENGRTSLTLTINGSAQEELQQIHSKSEKTSLKKKNSIEMIENIVGVESPMKKTKTKKDKSDFDKSLNDSNSKMKAPDLDQTVADAALPEEEETDEPSWANDPAEKRRLSAIGYQQYLNREGPKNLGSKEIPKAEADCLKGLTFVISGVLDSLERETAAELIQECGGKVTSSVSRKTSYIVLGEDAGPSKVQKAKQCGTKQLDEDGLLDLIRSKSGVLPPTPCADLQSKPKETTSEYFDRSSESSDGRKQGKIYEEKNKSKSSGVDSKSFYGKSASKVQNVSPSSGCLEQKTSLEDRGRVQPLAEGCNARDVPPKAALQCATGSSSSPDSGSVDSESKPTESLMWVDKYRPTSTKQIIGQQLEGSNMKRLMTWLQNWHVNHSSGKKINRPSVWEHKGNGAFFKAALLSGPPGVGKTTTAHLVCKELGLDVVEFNASDTRGQKRLQSEVGELLSSKSLYNYFQGGQATSSKHVLIMDEVDGMAGNEDRGGITALMQLIKTSKVPIICMCNNRHHQKLRTFLTYCFDLKFEKPKVEQIRGAMMTICFKEGLKVTPSMLGDMISGSSQDIRQILHNLSMYATKGAPEPQQAANKGEVKQIKNIKLGPWEVLVKVFSANEHKTMSMNDKSALFFYDYNLASLFVQENYLHVEPDAAQNNKYKRLDLLAEAADSLCWGDVVEKTIRTQTDAWSLLPTQAMFSSIVPGDLLSGTITRRIGFPQFLGRYSSRVKHSRLEQELHAHTRLGMSGSRVAFNLDYLRALRDALVRPLLAKDVAQAVAVMDAYHLMRTDLDSIVDIGVWSHERNPMEGIDSKVKAAFTRMLTKEGAMLPYSQAMGTVSSIKASAIHSTMTGEDEDDFDEGNEEDDSIASDAMIKAKKPAVVKKGRVKEPAAAGSVTKGRKGKGKSK